MANITKPVKEQHSCDIHGCNNEAMNPDYWGVSYPILTEDIYDDGSYFGGIRTRVMNRTIDLCEEHAQLCLRLTGRHTSNYGNGWIDDGPSIKAMGKEQS